MSLQPVWIAWLAAAVLMIALWFVQRAKHNAGIVDIAWSFATGLIGVWFCIMGSGDAGRRWLAGALIALWGFRLGMHLFKRIAREREDGRYLAMKEALGDKAQLFMFGFFQVQAFWAVLFAMPIWAVSHSSQPLMQIWDWLAIAIWILAIGGESIADTQLERFRSNPENKGKVCSNGLWKYSRHPNYFFEWLHWFAYVFLAVNSDYWWLPIAGMVMMYVFITRITGIPYTEKQSLKSRGDAYRHYQSTTSEFFPLPSKQT